MTLKKEGKVYEAVKEILQAKGIDTSALKIATLSPGPWHLILIKEETIGEYNHLTGQISLYSESIPEA